MTAPVETILAELRDRGDVVRRGKGWRCLCPAHDDSTPSLDIDVGADDRVLLCCRSRGCSSAQIVRALGLEMRDLFNGTYKPDKLSFDERILATYDYQDERGTLLFQTVRLWDAVKGKDFRQRRPDGKGGWVWRLDDTRRVLYRLPELVASSATVYVVEGEKDVLALTRLGLIATTNPMGAGKWRKEYGEFLRGRDVVILPDNDEPGHAHGKAVADSLKGVAASIKVVTLPCLPPKGDVSDWLAAGGTATKLLELVKSGVPPETPTPDQAPPAPPKSRFEFINSATFAGGDYRPEWLVSRVLVRGQPGVIAGPAKALKTNLSIDLAVSLASGTDFLGRFGVYKPVSVAVVSGESGEHTLQETARRVCKARGLALAGLERLHWCFTLPTFSDLAAMTDFANELAKLKADVVIIDPVYLALGAIDAKNLFEAGAAFRVVAETLLKVGTTPILNHHANRQLPFGEVMQLTHLAYSGLEQFARQFVLLNRCERYQGDGNHNLWMNVGGSCGQGGLFALRIEEGELQEDFSGRTWSVAVQTPDEVQEDHTATRERQTQEKHTADRQKMLDAIDQETRAGHEGATKTCLKVRTGFNSTKVKEILEALVEDGAIEECRFEKATGQGAKKPVEGFKRVQP